MNNQFERYLNTTIDNSREVIKEYHAERVGAVTQEQFSLPVHQIPTRRLP